MKNIVLIAAAAIGSIAIANHAVAHELDIDQDGLYSLVEIQAEYPNMTQAEYDVLDSNDDAAVDPDEFAAAVANGTLTPTD